MAWEKVASGQKLRQTPIHRGAYINDTIDVVNAHKEGRLQRPGDALEGARSRSQVEVRNLVGINLTRGQVVGLGAHLLTDVDGEHPWLEGNLVADPVANRFAILTRHLPAGQIGPAQISGVCTARVLVLNTAHTHATPINNSTFLVSRAIGPVELLMPPGGTGLQEIWVKIDDKENYCYHVTLGAGIAAGGSGSVTLPDGRTVTATNWSTATALEIGDRCLCFEDLVDLTFYLIKTGGEAPTKVWHGAALEDIAPGAAGNVILLDLTVLSATNWSNNPGVDIANGDYVLVWQDPLDNLYYCIKSGEPALRWFHATLDSPGLANGDATAGVTTTSALDGGAHPGAVTANNTWSCSGQTSAPCLIVQDSAGNYELVKVKAIVVEAATEILYDPVSERILKYKRQKVSAMREGAESGWQNIFAAEARNVTEIVAYDAGTNKLTYTTYVRYMLPTGGAAPTVNTIHTMVDKTVVDGVSISGTGQLTIDKETLTVWENTDASDDVLNLFSTSLLSVVVDVGQTGINIYQDKYLVNVINPISGPFRTTAIEGTMCEEESPGTTTLAESEIPFFDNNVAALCAATQFTSTNT